eukprot:6190938-Prymnesium_polylepis.1
MPASRGQHHWSRRRASGPLPYRKGLGVGTAEGAPEIGHLRVRPSDTWPAAAAWSRFCAGRRSSLGMRDFRRAGVVVGDVVV